MLRKKDEWKMVVPFSHDPSLRQIQHSSGVFFFADCGGIIAIRNSERDIVKGGFLLFLTCSIPAKLLQMHLDK